MVVLREPTQLVFSSAALSTGTPRSPHSVRASPTCSPTCSPPASPANYSANSCQAPGGKQTWVWSSFVCGEEAAPHRHGRAGPCYARQGLERERDGTWQRQRLRGPQLPPQLPAPHSLLRLWASSRTPPPPTKRLHSRPVTEATAPVREQNCGRPPWTPALPPSRCDLGHATYPPGPHCPSVRREQRQLSCLLAALAREPRNAWQSAEGCPRPRGPRGLPSGRRRLALCAPAAESKGPGALQT
uniref:Uncharacterized protein n=1 Tax=Molossus molossus TaxID=27622 RepID=A0A7J8J067_MOLMO|nr:hypothetical protein HJG59_010402 [Molossus molossus]